MPLWNLISSPHIRKVSLAALLFLGTACHSAVPREHQVACEIVRADDAIFRARQEARHSGRTTDGLPQVNARLQGSVWIVVFWNAGTPLSVGGPGFEVRLDCVDGSLVKIGDFQ